MVLIPDQRDRRDLYKLAGTDAGGRFTLRAVPPGSYRLFAFEEMERNSWFDPTVLRAFENRGTPVVVGEASNVTIELKAIPAEAVR